MQMDIIWMFYKRRWRKLFKRVQLGAWRARRFVNFRSWRIWLWVRKAPRWDLGGRYFFLLGKIWGWYWPCNLGEGYRIWWGRRYLGKGIVDGGKCDDGDIWFLASTANTVFVVITSDRGVVGAGLLASNWGWWWPNRTIVVLHFSLEGAIDEHCDYEEVTN